MMANAQERDSYVADDTPASVTEDLSFPVDDWIAPSGDKDHGGFDPVVAHFDEVADGEQPSTLEETRPVEMRIGYLPMGKKEVLSYASNWARDSYATPRNTFIQVRPYRGGFMFEVHNGGVGRGALSSIIKLLEETDSVLVQHSMGGVRIMSEEARETVHCFIIDDEKLVESTDGVKFQDAMKRLEKPAAGIAVAGIALSAFGITAMMCAAIFKYGMFNSHHEPVIHANVVPFAEIARVTPFANNDQTYVSQLLYKNGKWDVKTNDVIVLDENGSPVAQGK